MMENKSEKKRTISMICIIFIIASSIAYLHERKRSLIEDAMEYSRENMSKQEIYKNLRKDDYLKKEANYAINNISVDWEKNALKAAEGEDRMYIKSDNDIRELLKYKKFKENEIKYAIDNYKFTWKENALYYAEDTMEKNDYMSKERLKSKIIEMGFKESDAEYAVNSIDIDWKERAFNYASTMHCLSTAYYDERFGKGTDFHKVYEDILSSGFTEEEAEYAMEKAFYWTKKYGDYKKEGFYYKEISE